MSKYIVISVVICLYVAGSTWIVGSAGEAYRRDLRRDRLAAQPNAKPEARLKEEKDNSVTAATALTSASSRPDPAAVSPSGSMAESPPAQSADQKTLAAPTVTGLADTKQSLDPPVTPAPGQPSAGKPEVNALPRNADSFWDSPALTDVWDLARLKTDDELRLGRALHELIVHFNEPLTEGPWLGRVEEAAEPLLEERIRKDIPYTFTVLDSDAVNVFSHPGGYIYFSRGLFDLIGEDEEYALQFVVGHEIAHVDLQHTLKCLQDPGVKKLGKGTLPLVYFLIIPWGYQENQDFEADKWVFQRMTGLGRTKRESLAFLRKFEGYARINGFENIRAHPKPGAESSLLENHYRAHPIVRRRLKELESLMTPASKLTK